MSSTSAPTFSTFAFDVPEPDSIDGSFVYNYFLKDERTSTNPRSDAAALQRHGDKPARKVKIVFTPLNQISTLPAKPGGDIMRENDIRSNLSHILSEVENLCTDVSILKKGNLIISSSINDIQNNSNDFLLKTTEG